jgi:CRP-like cAMP-binding protein
MDNLLSDLSNDLVQVKQGTVIMKEGEIGQCAYFLIQGRLYVEKNIDGENMTIAEIVPRDIVGEFAILDDAPRSATVTTAEDSILIVLNKHRIRTIIRRTPAVAEVILKLLCHKLRTRHKALSKSSELSSPVFWIKVLSLLKLCLKASNYSQGTYRMYIENLFTILEVPQQQIREIFLRLEESDLIETEGSVLKSINEDYIDLFCRLCKEEYMNYPISNVSAKKEYEAIQLIIIHTRDVMDLMNVVEINKEQITQFLASSDLWKYLRPRFQLQRSEAMIEHLSNKNFIKEKEGTDTILFQMELLNSVEKPEAEMIPYQDMVEKMIRPAAS